MTEEPIREYIPPNLAENGGMLGGIIKARNAIETVIVIMLAVFIGKGIGHFAPPLIATAITIVIALIAGAVSLIGINGEPLSIFIFNVINYRKTSGYVPIRLPMPKKKEQKKKGGNSSVDAKLEEMLNAISNK